MKKIGIIGYGWLGERIANAMSGKYELYATTTTPDKANELNGRGMNAAAVSFPDFQLEKPLLQWDIVENLDVLIITIPVSEKSCCVSSLYNRIRNLSSFIGDFKGQVFLMSSTGVYPDLPKELTEEDMPVEKVSGERMIRNTYPQANILRLAGLMGDNRLLKNYNIAVLDAPVNHIHYSDICSVIIKMIERGSEGKLYNISAPLHPSKDAVVHAQKNLPFAGEKEPEGRKIISAKMMTELDFVFQYPDPRKFHEVHMKH
ncbi:hypothetical protein [Chryseobacterium arthrosphaerae]|uniref:hypothetical protein n=1 Tax=Chryseobacterium arthrosphaerae TaxID=651561 RepID=UPI001E34869C|nr:hypothetical protein [Chryseobacterium arthrosphaerae]UEQ77051.1 hypothetical protein J8N07_01745 [Chryseobacterium arthrosphaerae]